MLKDITLKQVAIAITVALTITSCGGNSESPEAVALYNSAKACLDAHHPQQALSIIDSLAASFPKEITVQRRAMHLRTLADSAMIDIEMAQLDSTLIADSLTVVKLKPLFSFVKTADMVEGYYIITSLKGNPLYERTGIEPRIDETGNIFLASCLFGVPCKHTALSASIAGIGEVATGNVPYDEALNYRYQAERGSCEMVTFEFDKCSEMCNFIAQNRDSSVKLTFKGNRNHSITLSPTLVKAIADSYDFSMAMRSGKNATAKKIFMAKKRELNRQQMAKTAKAIE